MEKRREVQELRHYTLDRDLADAIQAAITSHGPERIRLFSEALAIALPVALKYLEREGFNPKES